MAVGRQVPSPVNYARPTNLMMFALKSVTILLLIKSTLIFKTLLHVSVNIVISNVNMGALDR